MKQGKHFDPKFYLDTGIFSEVYFGAIGIDTIFGGTDSNFPKRNGKIRNPLCKLEVTVSQRTGQLLRRHSERYAPPPGELSSA